MDWKAVGFREGLDDEGVVGFGERPAEGVVVGF
jgi:hypothetical protein